MKKFFFILMIALPFISHAEVLTFDELTTDPYIASIPSGYGGLTWDMVGAVNENVYPDSGYERASVSGTYAAFNVLGEIGTVSGPVFDFNGVYLIAAWREGLNITVSGYNNGALLYETTVVVDLYEPTWFDFNYSGIDTLVFESFGGTDVLPNPYIGPHFAMDNFTINEVITPPTTPVSLDIIPQACPNKVNVKSKGKLSVAIPGTEALDVGNIDIASLELLGLNPIKSSYEDATTPAVGTEDCDCTTAGPDGFMDLMLKFDRATIINALGPVNDEDIFMLTLTGLLIDGTAFEATDCILIMKKGK